MGKLISNKEFKKLYGEVIHEGTNCIETDKGFVIYKAQQKTTTKGNKNVKVARNHERQSDLHQ